MAMPGFDVDDMSTNVMGGSLLGAAAGGLLALMTGQRVLPNIIQGAVTGAMGGAVVSANEMAAQRMCMTFPFGFKLHASCSLHYIKGTEKQLNKARDETGDMNFF